MIADWKTKDSAPDNKLQYYSIQNFAAHHCAAARPWRITESGASPHGTQNIRITASDKSADHDGPLAQFAAGKRGPEDIAQWEAS